MDLKKTSKTLRDMNSMELKEIIGKFVHVNIV